MGLRWRSCPFLGFRRRDRPQAALSPSAPSPLASLGTREVTIANDDHALDLTMQAQIRKLLKELRARHDTGILNPRLQHGTASWSCAASASSSADYFPPSRGRRTLRARPRWRRSCPSCQVSGNVAVLRRSDDLLSNTMMPMRCRSSARRARKTSGHKPIPSP